MTDDAILTVSDCSLEALLGGVEPIRRIDLSAWLAQAVAGANAVQRHAAKSKKPLSSDYTRGVAHTLGFVAGVIGARVLLDDYYKTLVYVRPDWAEVISADAARAQKTGGWAGASVGPR